MKWALRGLMAVAVIAKATVAPAGTLRLTLDEAVERAAKGNTLMRISRTEVETARANVARSQFWVPENPYVSGGLQRTPQSSFAPNYGLNLSQEIEIAGQRSRRIAVAEAALARSEWDQRTAERDLAANVELAFNHALLADERVALAQRGVDWVADAVGRAHGEKPAEGAEATIDRNLLVIQEARSRRELHGAELAREADYEALRELLALPPEQTLELSGAVSREIRPLRPEAELVAAALVQRPDLTALQYDAERASKQVPLAKREGVPNVTFSANVSRFESDTFAGGDIGFYLPVLRNNDPDVLEAVADRQRTELQVEELRRSIEREVRDARRTCVATGEDLALSRDVVLPRSRENLELQRKRFDRREVGSAELIGVLIDAQVAEHEYIDAVQAYSDAWIELGRSIAGAP